MSQLLFINLFIIFVYTPCQALIRETIMDVGSIEESSIGTHVFTISGTFDSSFSIELQDSMFKNDPNRTSSLFLVVRPDRFQIARNSYRKGFWHGEETKGGYPLSLLDHFEIAIVVERQHFQIYINKVHFCEYRHREPVSTSRFFILSGGMLGGHVNHKRA